MAAKVKLTLYFPEELLREAQQEVVKSEYFVALKEARRLLFNTYLRAINPKHKIEALKELRANIQAEADMRQTLGLLERVPDKIEQKLEVEGSAGLSEEDIARYIGTVVKVALEQEASELNQDDAPEDPE